MPPRLVLINSRFVRKSPRSVSSSLFLWVLIDNFLTDLVWALSQSMFDPLLFTYVLEIHLSGHQAWMMYHRKRLRNTCSFALSPQRHTTFHSYTMFRLKILRREIFKSTPSFPDASSYITTMRRYPANKMLEGFYVLNLLPHYYKAGGTSINMVFTTLTVRPAVLELLEGSASLLCISALRWASKTTSSARSRSFKCSLG